jgi:hypothetical protein
MIPEWVEPLMRGLRPELRKRLSLRDIDEIYKSVADIMAAELAEARRDAEALRELLAMAAEYTRHSDYDWDLGFSRDVAAAIDAARVLDK